tara:strand:- start:207 stop:494 length:288 start_codon:yes stop_codon:yes gene_type:complete
MPNPKPTTAVPVLPHRVGFFDMIRIVFMALCGGSIKGANTTYHGLAMAEDSMVNIRVSTKTTADAAFELEANSQPDGGVLMRQTKADIIAETNWS